MPAKQDIAAVEVSEARVSNLVESYSSVTELHPLLVDLCTTAEMRTLIDGIIDHEKAVIDQRSHDFGDNELTIYQHAFSVLSQYEDPYPAVALWVEEILGVDVVPVQRRPKVIENLVKTKHAILQSLEDYQYAQEETQYAAQCQDSPATVIVGQGCNRHVPNENYSRSEDINHVETDETTIPRSKQYSTDHALNKLINTYHSALADFHKIRHRTFECTEAAKFLRDTIENCTSYVENKYGPQTPERLEGGFHYPNLTSTEATEIDSMKAFLPIMSDIAERACGGKKRSFERRDEVQPSPQQQNQADGLSIKRTRPSTPAAARNPPSNYSHKDFLVDRTDEERGFAIKGIKDAYANGKNPRLGSYSVTPPSKKPKIGREETAPEQLRRAIPLSSPSRAGSEKSAFGRGRGDRGGMDHTHPSQRAMIYNDRIFGEGWEGEERYRDSSRQRWPEERVSSDYYRPCYHGWRPWR